MSEGSLCEELSWLDNPCVHKVPELANCWLNERTVSSARPLFHRPMRGSLAEWIAADGEGSDDGDDDRVLCLTVDQAAWLSQWLPFVSLDHVHWASVPFPLPVRAAVAPSAAHERLRRREHGWVA